MGHTKNKKVRKNSNRYLKKMKRLKYERKKGKTKKPKTFPIVHKPQERIIAPEVFDLSENSEEVLLFFADLESRASKGKYPIFLNLKSVKKISRETIIYLLSRMTYYRSRNVKYHLALEVEKNSSIEDIIKKSGLLKFLKKHVEEHTYDEDIYSIISGSNKDDYESELVSNKVMEFCYEKSNFTRQNLLFNYSMLVEGTKNAHEHAYKIKDEDNTWWLAVVNSEKSLKFIVMDNGRGIVKTVRKNFLLDMLIPNYEILNDALTTENYRSKTGIASRGNGLKSIYDQLGNHNISTLKVMTNDAYFKDESLIKLKSEFKGTMIIWEIDKNKNANDFIN